MVHNFGVYGQNGFQQQQQHMMNGGQNHQRFNAMHMPKQQQHSFHHNQHHSSQQHGGQLGHQHNISASAFQSGTPHLGVYGQEHMQNGTRDDGMDDEYGGSEYWQEQHRLFEECRDQSESHQRARTFAQQSKSMAFGGPLGGATDDATMEDRVRSSMAQANSRQAWTELDFGGQGLRALSPNLYKYTFLTRLNLTHNGLVRLPETIGQLKQLEHLDVSFNNLVSLPDEIGMLTNLKILYLCGNADLMGLPWSLGYLYKLETLAVYNINMTDDQKHAIAEGGTKGLINYLLENMPEECK